MSRRVCAVVLAGGLGTRLRSVLPDLPKPMAPVAGRPFIEWVVRYLAVQGIAEIIISTGYRSEAFAHHFSDLRLEGLPIECISEPLPLGTAGGFLHASASVKVRPDAWLVLNGDSLVLADLGPMLATLNDVAVSGVVLGLWMEDASRYGSLKMGDGDRLLSFDEKRSGASWVNAGIYLLRDLVLEGFPDERPLSWELDVFPHLLKTNHNIKVCRTVAPFLDIGTPETLSMGERFIRSHSACFDMR